VRQLIPLGTCQTLRHKMSLFRAFPIRHLWHQGRVQVLDTNGPSSVTPQLHLLLKSKQGWSSRKQMKVIPSLIPPSLSLSHTHTFTHTRSRTHAFTHALFLSFLYACCVFAQHVHSPPPHFHFYFTSLASCNITSQPNMYNCISLTLCKIYFQNILVVNL